jgi:ligand-binding sensor domain-containing protein
VSRVFRTTAWIVFAAALPVQAARQVTMVDFVQDVWDAGATGLPHPGVTSILETRDGYLWVATFAGVVRFDGARFEPPLVTDSPGRGRLALRDHVRSLIEAQDGAMWFATRREGVVRLKDGRADVFTTKDGLVGNDNRVIVETPDGTLWFAGALGVSSRDKAGTFHTWSKSDGLPSLNITAANVDTDGTLWVGTTEFGVAHFDGKRFVTYTLDAVKGVSIMEDAPGQALQSVAGFTRDRDGVLWAATSVGLVRVPERGPVPPEIHLSAINGVWPSPHGGVWASTGGGLGLLRDGVWRKYTSREGLVNDGLSCVYEDGEGSLWIGTRVGLARLRPRVIRTYTQRDGVGHDSITSVLETSDGALWVGHRNGASRFFDGRWTNFGMEQGLTNPSVRALAQTADGSVWIATLQGLGRYKDGRVRMYHGLEDPYTARALETDAQGRLWVATFKGIDRLEGDTLVRQLALDQSCETTAPNFIYAAKDGTIWAASGAALMRFRDGKTECFRDKDVLARNDVRSLYEDAEGQLWATHIGGISRIVDGVPHPVVGPGGPFDNAVYGMLDDGKGSLWCSTPQGLYQIDKAKMPHSGASSTDSSMYRAFGAADGMETPVGTGGGEPTAFRGRDGRMWFATASGVAVVDPSRIDRTTPQRPVYIDHLLADRQPVDLKGTRRLPAGTRDLELHFALLSFVAPEQVQYKYQLEGYDQTWIESGGRRDAYYANLPPGHYRFRVIAANHNGVWNDHGAALDFDMLPHLYQRRWFAPVIALLLGASAIAFYRWRVARFHADERNLKRRVDEAVANAQMLRGLLPICASCKKVRSDTGYWSQIETYVMAHSEAKFSHGVCPDCWEKMRQEEPGLPEYGQN